MDNLNENLRLHVAGATLRHSSPFAEIPTHKNPAELSHDFISKWAAPFYMEIGTEGDKSWIEKIKEIKHDITRDICFSLLGDFNWRTRLVGAYFSAVKGYDDLVDIIGTHLLKSEVCCVGHIYAVTLAYFNTNKTVDYLNQYLDYYLTTPHLYFDQKWVMQAILYTDQRNNTQDFNRHLEKWKIFEQQRKELEKESSLAIARQIEKEKGKPTADRLLEALAAEKNERRENFTTEYMEGQISALRELAEA